jgi:hypothetical protein
MICIHVRRRDVAPRGVHVGDRGFDLNIHLERPFFKYSKSPESNLG